MSRQSQHYLLLIKAIIMSHKNRGVGVESKRGFKFFLEASNFDFALSIILD